MASYTHEKAYTWFTQSGVKNPHLTSTVTGDEMVRLLSVFRAAWSSPNRVLWPSGTGAPMEELFLPKVNLCEQCGLLP